MDQLDANPSIGVIFWQLECRIHPQCPGMPWCPGTTFSIRIYKNGVKGISASVQLLASWKWVLRGFRFPIQIFKPHCSSITWHVAITVIFFTISPKFNTKKLWLHGIKTYLKCPGLFDSGCSNYVLVCISRVRGTLDMSESICLNPNWKTLPRPTTPLTAWSLI